MNGSREFNFGGQVLTARQSGALWWPKRRMLVVSDLHLGRTERYARAGGALLPPWHDEDTLALLGAEILALSPSVILSLGDSFDDNRAANEASPQLRLTLNRLAQGLDWIWIEGNHDPAPLPAGLMGRKLPELEDIFLFRHHSGLAGIPEISGHFHPVASLARRRWRCFAYDDRRLILPAFGRFTGGLDINSPDFRAIMPKGLAICCSDLMFVLPIAR